MSVLFRQPLISRLVQRNHHSPFLPVIQLTRWMASSSAQQGDGHQNRLALEKSPYLQQHAHNPVDWYPWGNEAFEKATSENKPIFLSVGYSTCHWCHVMERESFESQEIGDLLNEGFVAIKVDREERPDVDKVYMTFVQATSGGGGWPMSVWLTPDLRPIFGGTYFPPDGRYHGRPGFKTVLLNIAAQWKKRPEELKERGSAIIEALNKVCVGQPSEDQAIPDQEAVDKCHRMLANSYDDKMGGFGKAPKFPQPVKLNFMLRRWAQEDPESEAGTHALEMVLHTLRMMAKGGMYDHMAQGFHRYSTDADWHVPHFEKMLYDQGLLTVCYLEAYQITKEEEFAAVARDILTYVSRDLSDPSGGFYSAEDADSLPTEGATEKKEGAFCVWTEQEVRSLLSQPIVGQESTTLADVFCYHYDVQANGNVDPHQDPHDELKNQNVLIVRGSLEKTAAKFDCTVSTVSSHLEKARQILYAVRKKRPKPHLDNKMLTAWNGLMISGYAKAGQVLGDQSYTQRALAAIECLRTHMYDAETGTLLRCSYVGAGDGVTQAVQPIQGFLDDYAFLIRGLLDTYEASLDERLLQWAETLQQKQDELFWDKEGGGYYASDATDKSIVIRLKDDQDGAEPSANSVAAMNLLRLSQFLDREEYRQKAVSLLTAFGDRLEKIPLALPEMVCALMFMQATPKQIIIAGDPNTADTRTLLSRVHSHFLPNKVLLLAESSSSWLASHVQSLATAQRVDGKATAYVCENYTCSLPVTSAEQLDKLLRSDNIKANV